MGGLTTAIYFLQVLIEVPLELHRTLAFCCIPRWHFLPLPVKGPSPIRSGPYPSESSSLNYLLKEKPHPRSHMAVRDLGGPNSVYMAIVSPKSNFLLLCCLLYLYFIWSLMQLDSKHQGEGSASACPISKPPSLLYLIFHCQVIMRLEGKEWLVYSDYLKIWVDFEYFVCRLKNNLWSTFKRWFVRIFILPDQIITVYFLYKRKGGVPCTVLVRRYVWNVMFPFSYRILERELLL